MRYIMFNKPRGCVTACKDARHKTVMDYFPDEDRLGLFPVGRLDKDTEGLLIITDDGRLSSYITSPSSNLNKTYRLWAKGEFSEEKLSQLLDGVRIKRGGGLHSAKACKYLGASTLLDIADLTDDDKTRLSNTRHGQVPVHRVEITISEGKKHQVKRMMLAVGLRVVYLERVSIGELMLDDMLQRGEFRSLSDSELLSLVKSQK